MPADIGSEKEIRVGVKKPTRSLKRENGQMHYGRYFGSAAAMNGACRKRQGRLGSNPCLPRKHKLCCEYPQEAQTTPGRYRYLAVHELALRLARDLALMGDNQNARPERMLDTRHSPHSSVRQLAIGMKRGQKRLRRSSLRSEAVRTRRQRMTKGSVQTECQCRAL
jgi:hypothetical protein